MYQFRDPIHGFIDITEHERKIIDSPPFQRLRNIHQLATTYLVYHGAEHTRFGHSLGVMHLTSRVFDSVVKKSPNIFSDDNNENEIKTRWYRQILRLIGLTHDLGHAPFSHASEALFDGNREHEHYTRDIIFNTEIAEYIRMIGQKFASDYGAQFDITPELIWMIYEGKDVLNPSYIMPDFKFLQSFVDGELDCDKMDYLLRDSRYCGVTYGTYDLERFISTLTVYKSENKLQLAIEKGGVQALEEFILARYFMFIQVYFHKTRRYLDRCLVKCLVKILPNGKYPVAVEEYLLWDDARILYLISQSTDEDVVNYRNRVIMPCVYESSAHATKSDSNNFSLIYNVIKAELPEPCLIYDSIDKFAHKLTPALIPYDDDSGKGIVIVNEKTGEIQNLMEVSLILESIVKPISIRRLYVSRERESSVTERIKGLQMKPD